jgi:arylsulfatase A-like enzyme
MDDGIGKVLAALRETGLAERTLVVFASDNGGDAGAAGTNGALRGSKGGMYEGGIRVPMAAAWPGRIRPGSRSDRVALTMDLFPTFCEAAGAGVPAGIDGRSLLPELLGKPMPEETRTLFWVRRDGGPLKGGVFHAARRGDLKLVQAAPDKPFELFDLAADPAERTPLPEDHPGRRPIEDALRAHVARAAAVPWR